jgi:hypothetical protein
MNIKLKVPDEIKLIDLIHKEIEKNPHTWNDDGNILTGTLDGGKIVSNCPESQTSGEVILEVDAKSKKRVLFLKNVNDQKITNGDLKKTVFHKLTTAHLNNGYFELNDNLILLKELDSIFSPIFKNVCIESMPITLTSGSTFKELTLYFSPRFQNSYDHISISGTNLTNKYKDMDGYNSNTYISSKELKTIENENIIDIKNGNYKIGKYYSERNLITLNINPFNNMVVLSELYNLKDNVFLDTLLKDIMSAIKKLKPKTVDNKIFGIKIMATEFNKNNKKLIDNLTTKSIELEDEITHHQEQLTTKYEEKVSTHQQLISLTNMNNNNVDEFIKQIELVKKQPIITDVNIDNGTLNITFKPTTIKAKLDRNIEGVNDGEFVECFIGSLTVHLSGDGKMKTTCDYPTLTGNAHPHSNTENRPCLGNSEGVSLMHRLIGEKKFSEFIYVFWMWIKRWRPEDCYVKVHKYVDDRLQQGLPVFDKSGKRIELNDPLLIKNKTLVQLDKHTNYDKNIKLFKNYKSQK